MDEDDTVPLIDPVVGEAELDNIREVIESGYMTQGPFADEFESGFADYVDAEHAITATSCTTGMELVLDAMGIGPGDEVIVPDFTYPATASVVARMGADPVLVDVDRATYNVDTEAMADAVTEDTAALLPVSWGGQPLDDGAINDIAAEHDLHVLEDAACGAGASFDDRPVGSQFDASVFSFHPRKVLATGEGGMVTTDDDSLQEEVRCIKNFGIDHSGEGRGFVRADGTNFRFSDLLAAVGVAQLEKLDDIVERRREIAALYDDLLGDVEGVTTPAVVDGGVHNYQSYCVYVKAGDENTRDELMDRLGERNIQTQIGTYALSETEAFADATHHGSLENAKALYRNLLTLPVAHGMSEEDQHRVVDALETELDALTAVEP
jgi:dTDP-4-amino-4,6-dideoxygalactose transaminase